MPGQELPLAENAASPPAFEPERVRAGGKSTWWLLKKRGMREVPLAPRVASEKTSLYREEDLLKETAVERPAEGAVFVDYYDERGKSQAKSGKLLGTGSDSGGSSKKRSGERGPSRPEKIPCGRKGQLPAESRIGFSHQKKSKKRQSVDTPCRGGKVFLS